MDFKEYYQNQLKGIGGFEGARIQRGAGIGSVILSNIFRFIRDKAMPIIAENAMPSVSKISSEVGKGVGNFVNDVINAGPNASVKSSAKTRLKESLNNISRIIQQGSGKKRGGRGRGGGGGEHKAAKVSSKRNKKNSTSRRKPHQYRHNRNKHFKSIFD